MLQIYRLAIVFVMTALASPSTAPAPESAALQTVVRSSDGTIEISLPAGWKVLDDGQHNEYQIYAGSIADRASILIKTFDREDLVDASLEKNLEDASAGFDGPFSDVSLSTPAALTINGARALRREISGNQSNIRWDYQLTIIEMPKQIFWIYYCTNPSRMAQQQAAIDAILKSAKDLMATPPQEPSTKASGK